MGLTDMAEYRIGVIGGSGLYGMEELEVHEERRIETPFGEPSDPYILGELHGQLGVYALRVTTRGRRLAARVPADRRRWMTTEEAS